MKNHPPNLGILLLLEELSPEWNKLQDKAKNLGIPDDKADPRPGTENPGEGSKPEPGVGRVKRPRRQRPPQPGAP